MRKAIPTSGLILALGTAASVGPLGKAGGTVRPVEDDSSGITVVNLEGLSFEIDATGVESHLGRTTSHFDGALTRTGQDSFNLDGSYTTVAANGETLCGTFSGGGTSDRAGNAEGEVATMIRGGTGRFKKASGSSSGSFSQVFVRTDRVSATYATHYLLSGTITR